MKAAVTILDVKADALYARAADKLAELQARAADLERRRSQSVEGNSRSQAALTARAESFLQDDVIPVSRDSEEASRRGLDAIADELAVVRRALDLQRDLVERERARVSRAVCERLRPRHREIVGAIAGALRQLSAALEDERDLRDRLITNDIDFAATLRPMPFISGTLADPDSHASVWVRDARDAGLLG
jgi:hypothetical protein